MVYSLSLDFDAVETQMVYLFVIEFRNSNVHAYNLKEIRNQGIIYRPFINHC